MIFVTVGMHEQGFDRLIEEVDRLKQTHSIEDDVYIQKGSTKYIPKYCAYSDFLSREDMKKLMLEADVIICHGGPATFTKAMALGKKTIIVPRLKRYGEHVNNHQLDFLDKINREGVELTVVTDINDLVYYISETKCLDKIRTNTDRFCTELGRLIDEL